MSPGEDVVPVKNGAGGLEGREHGQERRPSALPDGRHAEPAREGLIFLPRLLFGLDPVKMMSRAEKQGLSGDGRRGHESGTAPGIILRGIGGE